MTDELKEEVKNSDKSELDNEKNPETVSENTAETNNLSETEQPSELEQVKAELAKQKDSFLRLAAEFDNYKKRNAKELRELLKTAGQDVIRDLLPVLDDYKRADKAFEQDKNTETYLQGLKLIQEKLNKLLHQKGLKEMDCLGKDFDVHFHEAIAEVPASTEEQKGKIIDVVEPGYTLNGNIIRYAKVVVGK